ncbi:hypothetical protein COCNU_03G005900 [Cocos nucifera]|uniref:Uncharacterized protein n=1 Tax=Cocos nucifera TaxID=13894 RepID=A0A8K0I2R3_COCNU|nr:hypothetical protein COCNU_03G005900 [Cocos nucifera]
MRIAGPPRRRFGEGDPRDLSRSAMHAGFDTGRTGGQCWGSKKGRGEREEISSTKELGGVSVKLRMLGVGSEVLFKRRSLLRRRKKRMGKWSCPSSAVFSETGEIIACSRCK